MKTENARDEQPAHGASMAGAVRAVAPVTGAMYSYGSEEDFNGEGDDDEGDGVGGSSRRGPAFSHRDDYDAMEAQLNVAIREDERFRGPEGSGDGPSLSPRVVDILLANEDESSGEYEAVISDAAGRLWRLPFDWDAETGTVTLSDEEPQPTRRRVIYTVEAPKPDAVVHCRALGDGAPVLEAAEPWRPGELVEFMWMPAGVHTIVANLGNDAIEITVQCDEETARRVQASLDEWRARRPKLEPFGCVEHREQEASVRVTAAGGFIWKPDGVYLRAEPTVLGATNVNGKVHRSWSPSFTTDAEYEKGRWIKTNDGRRMLVFPEGVRGSRSNPARITGVDFVVGTLTNKPAFHAIEPIRSREFTTEQRRELAKKGHALPDGSFPIENEEDLKNAIAAIGRAKNYARAKRHIIKRARALGKIDLLPESWRVKSSDVSGSDTAPVLRGADVPVRPHTRVRGGKLYTVRQYLRHTHGRLAGEPEPPPQARAALLQSSHALKKSVQADVYEKNRRADEEHFGASGLFDVAAWHREAADSNLEAAYALYKLGELDSRTQRMIDAHLHVAAHHADRASDAHNEAQFVLTQQGTVAGREAQGAPTRGQAATHGKLSAIYERHRAVKAKTDPCARVKEIYARNVERGVIMATHVRPHVRVRRGRVELVPEYERRVGHKAQGKSESRLLPLKETRHDRWEERDRRHWELTDAEGNTIHELWDEDVDNAIEEGFLDPDDPHRSHYEYAKYLGLIKDPYEQ